MATKRIRIGSAEDIIQYDDADFDSALETDHTVKVSQAPAAAEDVVRLEDLPDGTLDNIVGSTGNIDDNAIVRGDGGAKKVQDSSIFLDDNGNISKVDDDLEVDCGANKTIVLVEPVYNDINVGGLALGGPAANLPDEVQFVDELGANTGIYTYGFDTGEQVAGSLEIPHDYKEGTDLVFHVHWQGIAAPTGTDNVQWQLTYTVTRGGSTLDPVTVITIESGISTQYSFVRSDFAAIDGANFEIGNQFLFSLERIAASADEYSGDALIATVGFHYEIDTLGSRQITTK